MQNGLGILELTDTSAQAIFVDQDTLECARLNAKAQKNRTEAEQAQRAADDTRRKAEHAEAIKRSKAEKAAARRRAYNIATAKYLLARFAVSGVMAWGWAAGLIHPLVSLPLILVCLCTASGRLGEWRVKSRKKEDK